MFGIARGAGIALLGAGIAFAVGAAFLGAGMFVLATANPRGFGIATVRVNRSLAYFASAPPSASTSARINRRLLRRLTSRASSPSGSRAMASLSRFFPRTTALGDTQKNDTDASAFVLCV